MRRGGGEILCPASTFQMRPSPRFLANVVAPTMLGASLLFVYLRTLAPGLTWANHGSDGGDLITAAFTAGVPHPTGYPLYLILAGLFQSLPLGSLAFRTNLMSALAASLAAVLVYAIVARAQPALRSNNGWLAGMVSGYVFGLAPLVWSQAVITEVYALQALLTAWVLYLYTRPVETSRRRLDVWRGLGLGLATSNHLTALLLVPAAFLAGSFRDRAETTSTANHSGFERLEFDTSALLRQLVGLATGLSLYLILPVRALANPPVNWGNAVTPARFWWLVSGQIYRSYYLHLALAEVWEHIQSAAAVLLAQFGIPGTLLALVGLVVYWERSGLTLLTSWVAVVFTAFNTLYGSPDSQVYLIPVVLSFAVWAGMGVGRILPGTYARGRCRPYFMALLIILYFALRATGQLSRVDASKDIRAETFANEVLATAPENAIVFAEGDEAVFALWYYHFALGERADLAILATDLLHFDWYQENLRATYPSLVVPGPFPWPEAITVANPSRIACYVQHTNRTEISCPQSMINP